MEMKRNISTLLQTAFTRLAVCALVFGVSTVAYGQTEDGEEQEAAIRQPKRTDVKQDSYPTMELKGQVLDQATGQPLAGVQLRALGYDRYVAMSDEDGTFTIKVPTFATSLYVHSPEYLSQQVAIDTQSKHVVIKMISDRFQSMYGTGTEYTAKRTALMDQFGVTVDAEIGNKLGADVHTILRSASVDGGGAMFIRGLNSITSDAQPLIVVDGIEMDMQRNRASVHNGQFNNLLANIAPDDIEKVTVLNNATALYGACGANGVVLIDTKRGHSMATRIDANISAGVQLIPQLPTMMDAAQYRTYASELFGTIPDINDYRNFYILNDDPNGYYYRTYHNNTDWKDHVYRDALTQNYSVNVQGGDDVGMYNLSVGYVDAKNTMRKSGFDRMNVRFNTDIKILYNLQTKFDIAISRTNANVFDDGFLEDPDENTLTSPATLALVKSPLVAPYQYNVVVGRFTNLLSDYDDLLASSESPRTKLKNLSLANPVSILHNGNGDTKNKAENTYFLVHLAPEWQLATDWKLSADLNYLLNRNAQRYHRPFNGVPSFEAEERGTVTSKVVSLFAKEQNFAARLQANWHKQMGPHTMDAFVGARYNYFSFDSSDLSTEFRGTTDDKNAQLSASGLPGIGGANDVWKTIQWYGNADYNYMNRYFATVSLMAEANSRFGENAGGLGLFGVQWAIFPSVQLGWVLTNEKWFPKTSGINYLRLNAGYDMSGNDNISNYAARTSFSATKYANTAIGIQLTNIGNDKIQWETTHKLNLGLQAYLLNNRLGVGFDYFYHRTNNLLLPKSFSNPIGGINNYWSNGGTLENQGFEAMVSFKPVVAKNWRVEVGATVGHYVNKVKKLPDGNFTSSAYGDNNIITAVGQPVAMFYGYKTDGIFTSDAEAAKAGKNGYLYMQDASGKMTEFRAGDVHFVDLNNDGIINESDRTIIGNPNPDIYGNIFANVNYKRLTLAVGFNYSLGNDVFNYQRSVLNSGSSFYNQQVASASRWYYEGQQAELPRAVYGDPMGNNRFSDRWIEDGSYLRLKSVNLSYRVPVPTNWSWLQGLTVWAEARNLLTFTKYLGSDPEFSISNSVFYQGIDAGTLAQGRSFMGGVRINL